MAQEWMRDFVVNFGDDEGNEATFNGTVVQALLLLNGPRLNEAVKSTRPGSTVARAAQEGPIGVNTIFRAALGRNPNAREIAHVKRMFEPKQSSQGMSSPQANVVFQDVLWALLNSNEFILNH
jgi:hypothetical protein